MEYHENKFSVFPRSDNLYICLINFYLLLCSSINNFLSRLNFLFRPITFLISYAMAMLPSTKVAVIVLSSA